MNAIFINLKEIDYTILDKKFQFYIFNLKIIDFICDSNNRFFKIAKMIKNFEIIFLLRCFRNQSFSWYLRILLNKKYKFYYYFFYLSSFKDWKTFCIRKKIKNYDKYFEIGLDNCICFEIFNLFIFSWRNYINNSARNESNMWSSFLLFWKPDPAGSD